MIYGAVGWFLTAAAGMRNRMLVGCFREEEVTARRKWVSCFFPVACSTSGSGRRVGRKHAVQSWFSWIENFKGEVSEERREQKVSLKSIPVRRRGVVAGGVDTHSYCSGHMLMRVTGL